MRSKLIKDKMSSLRPDRADSHTGKEQHVQKLQQKLNMVNDSEHRNPPKPVTTNLRNWINVIIHYFSSFFMSRKLK